MFDTTPEALLEAIRKRGWISEQIENGDKCLCAGGKAPEAGEGGNLDRREDAPGLQGQGKGQGGEGFHGHGDGISTGEESRRLDC